MNPAIGSESYLTKPTSAVRLDTKTENRRFLGLSYFFLLLLSFSFVSPVSAEIAFVKTIGTTTTKTTGTSTSITVPASGVAAGNSIIVALAMDPASGTVSCTDTQSNSYTSDRDISNGSGTNGVRIVLLSAHNLLSLSSGNTITCTHPNVAARAASANEFSGLAATDARDQTAAATGNSTQPSSGSTPNTTHADELLFGGIGVEGPSNDKFTAGSSYTTIGRAGTNGGNAATNITVNPEYRVVSSTGAYAANGTLSANRQWAAAIITYKAATASPATKLGFLSVNNGSNPTAGTAFSVVVQALDGSGNSANVSAATDLSLSLKTGTGILGGTLTGTIAAGTNQATINGVTYTKAESGVVLTATRTSGDALTAADSDPFTVNAGATSVLVFTTQPGTTNAGSTIGGPPTVAVQDGLGNTVASSTASVTVAIGTNPGGGTLTGTTTKNAVSGIASFNDLSINQAGNGYTLAASSTGLSGATSASFNILSGPSGGQGIAYIYDRLSRLRAVVDLASDAGIYNYDAVGNLLSIVRQSSSVVSVIEISTVTGPAGTTVTIFGTGFSGTCGQNTVTFNGTPATIISCTATQIVVNVPEGATSGPIDVIAPGGSASSTENFAVTPTTGTPVITDFAPTIGLPETSVNITGSGFETTPINNRITFNITRADASAATASSITAAVPTGATSGRLSIATPLGKATSTDDFFVPPFSFTAADVGYTSRISIGGNNAVSIASGNKIGLVTFDGNQGQQITLNFSAVTFSDVVSVSIQQPNGSILAVKSVDPAGGVVGPITLPVTGTYTIAVVPRVLTDVVGCCFTGEGVPATIAHLDDPSSIAVDGQGNVFFADRWNHRIRKIDANGIITTVAGNGSSGFSGDGGPALAAQLNLPWAVALDGQGNLFIADFNNSRVRKVTSSGTITTIAGNGIAGFSGDGGSATSAQLNGPAAVGVDTQSNLFVADYNNNRIRKIATNGIITTVAGNGTSGFSGDGGLATDAQLARPSSVAFDAQGNILIADSNNHRIRKVDVGGVISTIAGTGVAGGSGDGGLATSAQLNFPSWVSLDSQGNIFIAENHRIRKIDASGIITTVAGTGTAGFSGDGGPATNAQLWAPRGVAVDASGNFFIADTVNDRIRKVDTGGVINTLAGTQDSGDGGLAKDAVVVYPIGVAADGQGNLFVADYGDSRVRKINASGVITTIAGTGTDGYSGDGGPATSAELSGPWAVAVDAQGNLYIADNSSHVVRKVDANGIITTVAGTGVRGFSGDGGPATSARLNHPDGVVADSNGNIYIADTSNDRVRKVDVNGTITTFAGTGTSGYNGDNIAATSGQLNAPMGLAIDASGNLYIADDGNNRIRKVNTSGIISTVAGNGSFGYSGENIPATSSSLSFPIGVTVDSQGNMYISEERHRVRKVDPTGTLSTLTGTGEAGYNGNDLIPSVAQVSFPASVTGDSQGSVFIADTDNFRVRKIPGVTTGSMTLTLTSP